MVETKEEKKRKILRYLGDRFQEFPNDYFPPKLIAESCDLDKTEVKNLCLTLEKEGLIRYLNNGKEDQSYKIEINGLILLEGYSMVGTRTEAHLSQFKNIVKRGLDKMQIREFELQSGVVEAGKKHNLKDGLYYVVLIDLSGSTIASSKMGSTIFSEWIKKFIQITKDALNTKKRNVAIFIKSIGDGSLFLFRNFDDIMDWKNKVDELCDHHNDTCKKEGKLGIHQYHYRTILHLGEVYFDRLNHDANSFGVNLVFKVEKKFGKGDIGITEAVKQIILQEINSGKFKISSADSYSLGEAEDTIIPLWKLTPLEQNF